MAAPADKHWRWLGYYWRLRRVPPRGTALKAIELLKDTPKTRPVLDLGAGHGPDALAYLKAGWPVIAVEPNPVGLAITWLRAFAAGKASSLKCIQSDYTEFEPPECAVVNAGFSLPFCPVDKWPDLWRRIENALPAGGVFAGQFFGPADTWAKNLLKNAPSQHFTEKYIRELFAGYHIVDFKEVREAGAGPDGVPKQWHVYHVVARKR